MDCVLIDDDILVQIAWKLAAKKAGKKLLIFSKPSDFLEVMESFDPSLVIYIDSNLENDVRGEVIAREISRSGFRNLYLTTGYTASTFDHYPWIQGVVGKEPPWLDGVT